ncbi:hypothetical protein ACFX13_029309 [Malus domestica]
MKSQLQKPKSFSVFPKFSINPNYLTRHGSPSLINLLPRHYVPIEHNKERSSIIVRANSYELRPSSASEVALTEIKAVTIRAVVTVQISVGNLIYTIGLTRPLDDLADVFGGTMLLELLSAELDPQ